MAEIVTESVEVLRKYP